LPLDLLPAADPVDGLHGFIVFFVGERLSGEVHGTLVFVIGRQVVPAVQLGLAPNRSLLASTS
jgi:hypothetical protein